MAALTLFNDDKTFTNSEYNKLISNVYKYVKHYFNHVDKELYFQDEDTTNSLYTNMCISKYALYRFKYTLYRSKCIPTNGGYRVMRYGDILAGLYFPHNNVGDKIKIILNSEEFYITITDKNKIHLPLNDEHFIYIRHLCYTDIRIYTSLPFYSVQILLADHDNLPMDLNIVFRLSNENKYLLYGEGACAKMDYEEINAYKSNYTIFDKDEPSIITIQQTWKDYKERRNVFYNIWKNSIKDINSAIRFLPGIGIEYFNAMEHYNSIKR